MTPSAFSYRNDARVPAFDDSSPLIIFDGLCVLCTAGVQWMLKRDQNGFSRFAVIQSPVPRALYGHYGLDAARFDTFMVLADGIPYIKWAGAMAAARTMPWPWRGLGQLGRLVPAFIGDVIYDVVQRNRIGWFGAREACYIPSPADRRRFLELGPESTSRSSP